MQGRLIHEDQGARISIKRWQIPAFEKFLCARARFNPGENPAEMMTFFENAKIRVAIEADDEPHAARQRLFVTSFADEVPGVLCITAGRRGPLVGTHGTRICGDAAGRAGGPIRAILNSMPSARGCAGWTKAFPRRFRHIARNCWPR